MNDRENEFMQDLIKKAWPAVMTTELKRDLWPRMRARLAARHRPVPVLDWMLTVAVVVSCLLIPQAIAMLFCYL